MSEMFTSRIFLELKRKMEEKPAQTESRDTRVLEGRVKRMELMKTLAEIQPRAEKRKTKVDSVTLIREDRDYS